MANRLSEDSKYHKTVKFFNTQISFIKNLSPFRLSSFQSFIYLLESRINY